MMSKRFAVRRRRQLTARPVLCGVRHPFSDQQWFARELRQTTEDCARTDAAAAAAAAIHGEDGVSAICTVDEHWPASSTGRAETAHFVHARDPRTAQPIFHLSRSVNRATLSVSVSVCLSVCLTLCRRMTPPMITSSPFSRLIHTQSQRTWLTSAISISNEMRDLWVAVYRCCNPSIESTSNSRVRPLRSIKGSPPANRLYTRVRRPTSVPLL